MFVSCYFYHSSYEEFLLLVAEALIKNLVGLYRMHNFYRTRILYVYMGHFPTKNLLKPLKYEKSPENKWKEFSITFMRHRFLNTPLMQACTSTGNETRFYLNCPGIEWFMWRTQKIIRHLAKWLRIPVNKSKIFHIYWLLHEIFLVLLPNHNDSNRFYRRSSAP